MEAKEDILTGTRTLAIASASRMVLAAERRETIAGMSRRLRALAEQKTKTEADWKEAVTLARQLRVVAAAAAFGLVVDVPAVDVCACAHMLAEGRRHGVRPSIRCVEAMARLLA